LPTLITAIKIVYTKYFTLSVCGGVSVGALTVEVAGKLLASRGITLALGPVGWAVAGACTVYGLGRLADWW
jgi:hypothetical protein